MKKLILTATFFEAKAFLSIGNWVKKKRNLFENDQFILFITGIGKKNVLQSFSEIESIKFCEVFNIGICGGVSHFEIGESFVPQQVLNEEELQINNIKKIPTLITLLKPMKVIEDIIKLCPEVFINIPLGVDMEASFLKKHFDEKKIPIHFIKVFSDSGTEDFISHFKERKEILQFSLNNVAKLQLFNVVI